MTVFPTQEWLERIRRGDTLQSVATDAGITRQYVRLILQATGGYDAAKREGRARRTERSSAVRSEKVATMAVLLDEGKSIAEAASVVGCSAQWARTLLKNAGIIEEEGQTKDARIRRGDAKSGSVKIPDEEIFAALRAADAMYSHPSLKSLRSDDYALYAKFHGTASVPTLINRFGSWNAALAAAGVQGGRLGKKARKDTVGVEECVAAVRLCWEELGGQSVPSSVRYDEWSRGRKDVPSSRTVRTRLGGWRGVLRAVG